MYSKSLKAKAYNFTSNLHFTSFYLLIDVIALSLSRPVMQRYATAIKFVLEQAGHHVQLNFTDQQQGLMNVHKILL
jgi:hypothetical protein